MRMSLTLVLIFGGSIAASAQSQNYAPYNNLLAKECGAKHLAWISPADLNDMIIIDFEGALPKAMKTKLERANDEKVACANVTMGATCENVSHLKAMSKVGLLGQFAKSVCSSGLTCRGQSECSKPQP